MNRTLRRLAGLLAGVSLLAASGCYSVTVQASGLDKPVSVSRSIGHSARVRRSFRHETISWYLLGLIPILALPSGLAGAGDPADRLTREIVKAELAQGGDGIANLKVTVQYDMLSFGLGILASFIPIPIRPMSIVVEGQVVD